jgi:hypothetical protein
MNDELDDFEDMDDFMAGLKCPKCGNDQHLIVEGTVAVTLTHERNDADSDIQWTDESHTLCPDCEHEGKLAEFRTTPAEPAPSVARKFSVLLLYPEDDNEGGTQTYYHLVEAESPEAAVLLAQTNAIAANGWGISDDEEGEAAYDLYDFAVLLVTEGHHHDVWTAELPEPETPKGRLPVATNMTVARTIQSQIGPLAFLMMGTQNLVGSDRALSFNIRGSKAFDHVLVELEPSDTYKLTFSKKARRPDFGVSRRVVVEGIYVDQLHSVIEHHTGLYLSFHRRNPGG